MLSVDVYSQVVTTVPAFPTETSDITLTFDASKGNAGLLNFTGDVHAHTGVITSLSTDPVNGWRYVVADWGQFPLKTKLTRSASNPNLYTLAIGNPRTYYNVPAGEKILKLAFVFRSGLGTSPVREGKDVNGANIFVTLVEGSVNVRFAQPTAAFEFKDAASTIDFVGIGDATNLSNLSLTLKKGEQTLATATNDTIRYSLTELGTGSHTVMLIGNEGSSADTAIYQYTVRSQTVSQARPAGIEDGITDHGDGRVTFSLFAPFKNSVYLIGDFNDWTPNDAFKLKKDEIRSDSVHYWITVNGLTSGNSYRFQYLVDETIRVGDPYSKMVLDPNNDPWIEPGTYPNLIAYPTGKTTGMLSVFTTNEPAYQWKVTNFNRPASTEVIAYELHLRDFLTAHSFKALTDTLPYLQKLGINAIKLMPIAEFDGNDSWGYNPAYHMALDKYYGSSRDFKVFVDSAHAKGMAVVLDVVFNHATGQSPLLAMWWNSAINQAAENNPYAYVNARHPFNVFHDLKHGSTATNFWMKKVLKFWLQEYKIDGFRFDLSKGHYIGQTNDTGVWSGFDQWRLDHWKNNYNFIQTVTPGAYVILEHLGSDTEEKALANHGMILWGKMTDQYNEATMGYHDSGKSDFRRILHVNRGFEKLGLMGYMESHDEERLMYKNQAYGAVNGSYSAKSVPVALERMKAAGAFFYTIPGPKMLWQFGELGYDVSIFANEQAQLPPGNYGSDDRYRTSRKPIRWNYRADPARYNLYRTWSALMTLRKSDPLFTDITSAVYFDAAGALKRVGIVKGSDEAIIYGNFGTTDLTGAPGFTKTGIWYDWATGAEVNVTNTTQQITLKPGTFVIYTTKRYPTPASGILVDNEENQPETPKHFGLNAAYPNPFNPSTTISYQLAAAGAVKIEVVDLAGRKIATLADLKSQTAGSHSIQWNASGVGSGVYLIRMQAANRSFVQKVTLLK